MTTSCRFTVMEVSHMARIATKRESTAANFSIVFSTEYSGILNERLRINSRRYMGIGTFNPDEKLTVKGKVNTEIRVDLSFLGSDYVFEKDYPLQSLTDIQKYIQENKHLPDVPSENEMKEKGLI
jgi:hypothetical protein